ncbi:TraR/DksA C4-type zinc finger protein [Rahnella sp. C60]|uniref:TraR/DksA C4-type zinc finger protein n=1 Tax=Rahnella perminowiae TaxID=2816244 RepID=A0ABS6KZY1_9GAMM|nr:MULTISPECIES: TraR/DksA C4-type zinc finger protein [Rahnella]UJD87979.1 conjugal transfer protein TraR [Rahnella aquatilis]MBU9808215.1 TraR/DksA C4-type zinc finger protein [Rahnella perminowiae]MBU9816745.1 TraR/DksA C4-type zinc finger protein [Rahnella perminowiae]MBU9827813.1 TraR/DksA C4-type zinc finger protein [Rahnella perminowiae]MBU9835031.1 TraR/DksA C4-type zinc finger protein [Rahnella perminowiae]
MTDWIDESQEYQLRVLEAQISKATRTQPEPSALFCVDCEASIPEQRRNIISGVQRCIECQEIEELKRKNYRPV